MKVIEFRAENFKRLKVVEITPDGTLQVVAGRNAQGKTSVLDAIWLTLGGGAAAKGTARPIRDGQDRAEVTLDLGELTVTRTWSNDGKTALKVESASGARPKSPQALLDSLIGRLSFDPLAFAHHDDKTQMAILLALVDLPFDPQELADERRAIFERRTDVNRRAKGLQAQVSGMPRPAKDLPAEEVSASALLAELRDKQTVENTRASQAEQLRLSTAKVEALKAQRDELELAIRDLRANAKQMTERLQALPPAEDLSVYDERLSSIEDTNAAVRAAVRRREAAAEHEAAVAESDSLTDELVALDEMKVKAIEAAAMPVDGLGFDDEGVTYQGVPFRQCSAAERLRVSMAIAMADQPELRVIRITDGSLLDSENLALVQEMAAEHDFQVWVEKVDESGSIGVVIEDGQVA